MLLTFDTSPATEGSNLGDFCETIVKHIRFPDVVLSSEQNEETTPETLAEARFSDCLIGLETYFAFQSESFQLDAMGVGTYGVNGVVQQSFVLLFLIDRVGHLSRDSRSTRDYLFANLMIMAVPQHLTFPNAKHRFPINFDQRLIQRQS